MTRPASRPWQEAAKACAAELRHLAFDGQLSAMPVCLASYLSQWSPQDPFGRYALRQALDGISVLSFRSTSTSRELLDQERRARAQAWMSLLPFDQQLGLIQMEGAGYGWSAFRVSDLAWERWHGLLNHENPNHFFKTSELGGWTPKGPGPGSPGSATPSCRSFVVGVAAQLRQQAVSLAAAGHWSDLAAWMDSARLHAWDRMEGLYIHYRRPGVSGCMYTALSTPIPLWATGVFNAVEDPQYWSIMARHGGPVLPPCHARTRPPRAPARPRGPGLPRFSLIASPADWADPVAWLRLDPDSTMFRDPGLRVFIEDQVNRTKSAWKRQKMLSELPARDLPTSTPRL